MKTFHAVFAATLMATAAYGQGAKPQAAKQYHVIEVSLEGPTLGPTDTPARDIELVVTFTHESGKPVQRVHGFWDGDGKGGSTGNVFKVRLTPTKPGRWTITKTESSDAKLRGQLDGRTFAAAATDHPGFWIADHHWYFRSNGSYQFITGNTHYSFLSRRKTGGQKVGGSIERDIASNAEHFKKLRFSLFGDRYVDPDLKPFFDDAGRQTDDGRFSHRPNPAWFHQRADVAVRAGFEHDLICDLILCGPDTEESRSTLKGNPRPWLNYVVARYGSYPNVWLCLANEWNIKKPRYTADEICRAGEVVRLASAYPTPVSVHGNHGNWDTELNLDWHDHGIIQWKLKTIAKAADVAVQNHDRAGHLPVTNDENAYQGEGDKFSHGDTVEGCLGTILGGGYPTTGEKHGNKLGQYFWGGFDADVHTAAKNLGFIRRYMDEAVRFWSLAPMPAEESPVKLADGWRILGDSESEYLIGTNGAAAIQWTVPAGETWRIVVIDAMAMKKDVAAERATGPVMITTAPSRAGLVHLRRVND